MKLRLALPALALAALAARPAFADTWCYTFFGDDGPKNSLFASPSTDGKSVSVSLTDLTTGWKVGNVYYLKTGSDVMYVPSNLFDTGKANGNIAECTPTPSPSKDGVLSISYDSSTAKKYAQIAVRYIPWTYSIAFAKNATDAQGTAMTTMSGLSYTNTTTKLTKNAFTRTGYSFGGWTTDAANAGTIFTNQTTVGGEKFGVTSDGQTITLYAKWNANGYSVSYNENGGTAGSSAPMSATYDTPFLVSAPTKTGYSFTGWTVSGSGFNKDTAKSGSSETSCSTSISDGKVSTKGDVYLKNLASTANAAVTLTA